MGGSDDLLEEPIRFLDLVPIEKIRLTELEVFQLVGFDQRQSEDIGRGEDPAASGGPLVRDGCAFHRYSQVKDVLVEFKGVVIDEDVCKRVVCET